MDDRGSSTPCPKAEFVAAVAPLFEGAPRFLAPTRRARGRSATPTTLFGRAEAIAAGDARRTSRSS